MLFDRLFRTNRISQDKAKEMLDGGGVTLVDVRTPGEYAQGFIKGAMLLPLDRIAIDAAKRLPDKDATILVYCLSGSRSSSAAGILSRAGYTNVFDIGGIGSWPYGISK